MKNLIRFITYVPLLASLGCTNSDDIDTGLEIPPYAVFIIPTNPTSYDDLLCEAYFFNEDERIFEEVHNTVRAFGVEGSKVLEWRINESDEQVPENNFCDKDYSSPFVEDTLPSYLTTTRDRVKCILLTEDAFSDTCEHSSRTGLATTEIYIQ